MEFLSQFAIIIIVGVISGIIALKLKVPIIVGYIVGGAIFAIAAKGSFDFESIKSIGELGITLLLFSIGIEFSLDKLIEVKKFAVYGGIAQIILTTLFGIIVFPLLGFSSYEALFLGAVFSMSSTAVVVKILEEIGELDTQSGQITVGWLILQDIAVVVIIVLLANFAGGSPDFGALAESVFKSVLLILLALVVGRKVIPNILTSVAHLGSKELVLVCAICFALVFSLLADKFGVSFTLGAFLAGVMVSESFLQHEIFTELKPVQNIFAIFFFIVIGSLFSLDYLFANLPKVLLVLVIVTVSKFAITWFINVVLKLHIRNALEVAISIAQVGEFAFLSSQIGVYNKWISTDLNNLIISVTILSLLLSPLLISKSDFIFEKFRDYAAKKLPGIYRKYFMAPLLDIDFGNRKKNHIIICGFGRVGKYVTLALRHLHYKLTVIEFDPLLVEDAKKYSIDAIYGDATSEEILLEAGIKDAKAVIIALPKESAVISIAAKIKDLNQEADVIIRRHAHEDKIGESRFTVIEPEFETAVKIMEKMLGVLHKRDRKVISWLKEQQETIA